jgi:hypothetical protein
VRHLGCHGPLRCWLCWGAWYWAWTKQTPVGAPYKAMGLTGFSSSLWQRHFGQCRLSVKARYAPYPRIHLLLKMYVTPSMRNGVSSPATLWYGLSVSAGHKRFQVPLCKDACGAWPSNFMRDCRDTPVGNCTLAAAESSGVQTTEATSSRM